MPAMSSPDTTPFAQSKSHSASKRMSEASALEPTIPFARCSREADDKMTGMGVCSFMPRMLGRKAWERNENIPFFHGRHN
jgi:hypothetical protein